MTERERIRIKDNYKKAKLVYDEFIKFYPFQLENLDSETWKNIQDVNELYQVSNFGRIKSFQRNVPRVLKPTINTSGYLAVHMVKNGKPITPLVHVLVGKAFVPNPENKPELNHKDGIKFNCYLENLEWVTRGENLQHAIDNGLNKPNYGENNHSAKLTAEQVKYIRSVYKRRDKEYSIDKLAEKFGVCPNTIRGIIRGKTYKNVE